MAGLSTYDARLASPFPSDAHGTLTTPDRGGEAFIHALPSAYIG